MKKLSKTVTEALKILSQPDWKMWAVISAGSRKCYMQKGVPKGDGERADMMFSTYDSLIRNQFVIEITSSATIVEDLRVKTQVYRISDFGRQTLKLIQEQ